VSCDLSGRKWWALSYKVPTTLPVFCSTYYPSRADATHYSLPRLTCGRLTTRTAASNSSICFMHVMQSLCIFQAYLLLYVVMCSLSYANLCSLDLMRSPRYACYVVIMYILCVHFVMQLHVDSGHCNKNVFL